MSRIAVIQTAFPGDVILALPVFEALREIEPGCELTAVVRPESVCLLKNNPHVSHIVVFDKYGADKGLSGIRRVSGELKGIDKALIIQRHMRSALLAFRAGIKERIGYESAPGRVLYTSAKKYREDVHEVQRCLDLIDFDNGNKKYKPKILLDSETISRAEKLLDEGGIRYDFAVIAPGSVWPTKRYNQFQQVIDLIYDRFELQIILLGGYGDRELSSSISLESAHLPLDLTGQTDMLLSAAIMSKARIVIANDSAPGHLAAAVDTPVVSIFGPTIPEFGFAPYSDKSIVVDIGELECRPCSKHGDNACPRKHFKCMRELKPENVVDAVEKLLAR
jgi:heptosyltransferase II